MKRHPEHADQQLEPDAVWDLIDQSPTQPASAHFVRKTVQMVREERQRRSWWQRLVAAAKDRPATAIASLAAATAALLLALTAWQPGGQPTDPVSDNSPQAGDIEEAIATEMLMAAAENPSEFSDQELVVLLGL